MSLKKMNAATTAAATRTPAHPPPPPPRPVVAPVITSLTTTTATTTKQQSGTTSLAEALATSVADYVCDQNNRRKNNTTINTTTAVASSPPGPPKSTTTDNNHNQTTHNVTAKQQQLQQLQSRIVSDEHPKVMAQPPTQAATNPANPTNNNTNSAPPPQCQMTPRTVTNSCSSMSSAVADLASFGMNFQTTANNFNNGNNSNNGSSTTTTNNNRDRSNSNNSSSAPIISGTAAAVLALQSVDIAPPTHHHHDAAAIVSNPSSVETGGIPGGIVPDPLALAHPSSGIGGGVSSSPTATAIATANTAEGGANSVTGGGGSVSSSNSTHPTTTKSPLLFRHQHPTRYSDGAPIIAGTAAAAQMEAIATATAARITESCGFSSSTINNNTIYNYREGEEEVVDHVVNAVASLGSMQDYYGGSSSYYMNHDGGGGGVSRSHGFASTSLSSGGGEEGSSSCHYYDWNGSNNSRKTGEGGTTPSKALSWVDHRVTPDDGSGVPEGSAAAAYQVSLVSASQHDMPASAPVAPAPQSTTGGGGGGGGMDILAEITCHAPPMSVPAYSPLQMSSGGGSTTTTIITSYPQQQQQHHHSSSSSAEAPNTTTSAIPSYQEIYYQQQATTSSADGTSSTASYQAAAQNNCNQQVHQAQQYHHHQQQQQHDPQSQQQQQQQSTSNNNEQRVSVIPSYQEIYREMGLQSPKQQPQQQQQHHHHHHQAHHHQQEEPYSYSVEEVQVVVEHSHHHHHHQTHPSNSSNKKSKNHHSYTSNNGPSSSSLNKGDKHGGGGGGSSGNNSSIGSATTTTARTMSHHYNHRPPTTHFGHVYNGDASIEEGKELYTRKDLCALGGHLGHEHKDVHGNMREGCDSICIGNLERDIREADGLVWFLYSTDRTNGGGALCQSYHKKRPIRVFRSSLLGGRYAPPFLDVEEDEDNSDVGYRYDGLYMVRAVWDVDGHETESFPVVGEKGWQTYFVTRVPKKPLDKEKVEVGMEYNAMGLQELWGIIQKMRGVRRPKKFEIPQPPVKLPPVKRGAISGVYKDRKSVGYQRPEPVCALPPTRLPPQSQLATTKSLQPPRAKSPRTIPNETQRRRKGQQDVDSESSSSDEEEETKNQKAAEESDSDSDSDTSHKPQQHRASPLSARTPTKVMTPRPRLNSVPHHQPKKASPPTAAAANQEDDDSSDSETSTSAAISTPIAGPRKTKRIRKPSPKIKLSTGMDVSAFFPKRASAARAEAVNRDMLGSQRSYNKRKASETATAAAAAAAVAKQQRVSGRKKTKMKYHDDSDHSSSSVSSDEEQQQQDRDDGLVDQSILTVGSRVLVLYKAQLFKATIRKRRYKNSRHDFLIHYDGNKRTNVHWIQLDRIKEILEINVDTPPKQQQKKAAVATTKKKKKGGNNKRKAESAQVVRQQSLQENHYQKNNEEEVDSESSSKRIAPEAKEESDPSHDADDKATAANEAQHNDDNNNDMTVPRAESKVRTSDGSPGATDKEPTIDGQAAPQIGGHGDQTESPSISESKMPLEEPDEKAQSNTKLVSQTKADFDDESASDGTQDAAKEEELKSNSEAPATEDGMDIEELETSDCANNDSKPNSDNEVPKPISNNIKTTTAAAASARKPRKTVVSDVIVANNASEKDSETIPSKDPLQLLAEEAGSDESDENYSSSSSNDKQVQAASEPTSEFKYPIGSHVYVEYRHIFYSSSILKGRRKRSISEYLVHYEGYKKSSNRWVKEATLHEVNAVTTQRYEEQRLIPADILHESGHPGEFSMTTRGKKAFESSEQPSSSALNSSLHSAPVQKKPPPRRMRSESSETTGQAALENLEAGVDFLPGSMVFVEWNLVLYLAKMLKKRYSGDRMEYLISYDGYKSNHNAWVSIHKIYEVNPQSKRVYKMLNSEIIGGNTSEGKPKQRRAPPGPKRRETRRKAQDYDDIVSHSSAQTRNNGETNQPPSRASSRVQTSRATSSIDMQGIEAGVEFLPGSTLFAEYKDGLCLAKMLKKRGKGDYMEYFIQYNGLKKTVEAWVSTALVYEINPQTKRMFRKLSKKE